MKELISSTWEYLIRKINFDLHFDKQVGSKVGGVGESPSRQNRWAVTPDPHSGSEVQGGYERYTWVNLGPSVQSFVLLAEEFRVCPTSVENWRLGGRNAATLRSERLALSGVSFLTWRPCARGMRAPLLNHFSSIHWGRCQVYWFCYNRVLYHLMEIRHNKT